MDCADITDVIIRRAILVHRRVGPGLFESVYATLFARELISAGLQVERQKGIAVVIDGINFSPAFRADLVINGEVVVEVKSIEKLAPVHTKQILTYMRLLDIRTGLLINFGEETLKAGLKRVINDHDYRECPDNCVNGHG